MGDGLISIGGLSSGMDTDKIIKDLMAVERRSVTLVEARQERFKGLQVAYQSLNTKMLAFKADADALKRSKTFDAKTVTSSDTDVVTATVGRNAPEGNYEFTVDQLAKSHTIASQGYANSNNAPVGVGDLTITVGDGVATNISLSSGNNTLESLRDAINNSEADVTASIMNTGGDVAPYRLVLQAKNSGKDNTISIQSSLTGDNPAEFVDDSLSDVAAGGANTYTGTASTSGSYTGTGNNSYVVEIVTGGDEDSAEYKLSTDGGQTWGATETMSGGSVSLGDGMQMDFTAGTFADGDEFTVKAFVPNVQDPADALITVGEGSGAVQIASDTNTVDTVIPGATLNLLSTSDGSPVSISIEADTETIQGKIESFVESYNGVMKYITEQSFYDEDTDKAGVLLGDTTVQRMQLDLNRTVIKAVDGLPNTTNGLHSIGIMPNDMGYLSIDSAELNDALNNDLDGTMQVFSTAGESSNPLVSYVHSTSDTVVPPSGFDVTVTQAGTRGQAAGSTIDDPANTSMVIGTGNNQLNLDVDGETSGVIQLTDGTYTSGTALATEIQARINADSNLTSHGVVVQWIDEGTTGHLEITSSQYGSESSVVFDATPGNAAASLGLDAATSTGGQDVAGTIDGEAATGAGQMLLGASSGNAQGLALRVSATAQQITDAGGALDAGVSITEGIGAQAAQRLDGLTDPVDGMFKRSIDNFQDRVDSFQSQIDRQEELLAMREKRLRAEFVEMEKAITKLQSQSSLLSNKLEGFEAPSGGE